MSPLLQRSLKVDGSNLINYLYGLGQEFRRDLTRDLSAIMGGASLDIKEVRDEFDNPRLTLRLDSADDSSGFSPVNVGFGYSYVLPVVLLSLTAARGSTLIIENPEAHLHPSGQSALMNFIARQSRERDLQLFVETHSDHVINGLRLAVKGGVLDRHDAQILLFSREPFAYAPPEITTIHIDSQGELDSYPDNFMDELTRQLLELTRRSPLPEATAER